MFKRIAATTGILLALVSGRAEAQNKTIASMTAASALTGTELVYIVQSGADRKATPAQFATYTYSLASGDCTISGAGAVVCLKTNGVSFTSAATTSIGTSGATIPLLSTANTWTLGQTFSTAPTFASITGSTQCLHVNSSGVLSGTGSDCGAASGISSITPGAGLVSGITASCTQTAITTTGTLSAAACLNAQTGTTYAIVDGDRGKLVTGTNAAAQAYSIAQAGAASAFANGWYVDLYNKGVGTLTITPTTSTINGAASYALFAGNGIRIVSDGTNYQIQPGTTGGVTVNSQTGANYAFVATDFAKLVNLSNGSNQIPTMPTAASLGANWYTQACNQGAGAQTITPTTSTIGGTSTFVLPAGSASQPNCIGIVSDGTNYQIVSESIRISGTAALGTGAITSATCATVVTATATGVVTTDIIEASFNGDPTAVTGYIPATAGMLTIIAYPTANTVNFKVCNNTSSSVTPGAITLNWKVVR